MNIPQKIGRYQIEQLLGHGGMAVVYLARDPAMGRQVAIKLLPPQWTFDANLRQRFQQEAQIVAALEHPAIVPIYDYGEYEGQPYLVMRYMSGGSLRDRMNRPLPITEVARILERLAPALDLAHDRGVIHRDLKPDNVLFDSHQQPYLADFGIARIAEGTQTMTIVGTPAYMSPEQVQGNMALDRRADIYAIGVMLFEMLTGRAPYQAETPTQVMFKHVYEPIPDVLTLRADLPTSSRGVIYIAMSKDPAGRYDSAGQLAKAVTNLVAAPSWPPAVTPPPVAPKAGLPPVVWGVGGLTLLAVMILVAAGVLWTVTRPGPSSAQASIPTTTSSPPPILTTTVTAAPTTRPSTTPLPSSTPTRPPTDTPATLPPLPTIATVPIAIPLTGDNLVQLTGDGLSSYSPVYAPGQDFFIYAALIDEFWQLMMGDPNGVAEPRQLTNLAANFYSPRFAANGQELLVCADLGGNQDIYLFDLASNGVVDVLVQGPGDDYYPFWLPDGSGFLYSSFRDGDSEIYLHLSDGSPDRQLTNNTNFDGVASPSPDGRQVTFYSGRDGDFELYLMNLDGSGQRRLTTFPGRDATPIFSPDSQWILFESDRSGNYEIYAMRLDGSEIRNLTNNPANEFVPNFTPDGKWITFLSDRNNGQGDPMDIYRLRWTP